MAKKQRTANLQLVKAANLSLVFYLINQNVQTSRAELAHITGLSPTTVSSLVDELIGSDMVEEIGIGDSTTSGRKPILIQVKPTGGYVAAIEVTEEGFVLELYNLRSVRVSSRTKVLETFDALGPEIISAIEKMLRKLKIAEKKLLGVCIGVPAMLDKDELRVSKSSVVPIDETNDFFEVIQNRFHNIQVKMGVESCFCAYSEKSEIRRDIHSLVYININKGIGGGIVIENKIYTGAFGTAGEVGHVTVDPNGPKCECGNRGCLETLASVPAIKKKIQEAIAAGEETSIKPRKDGSIPFSSIGRALEKKDPVAMRVLDEVCGYLAIGINGVINILNPEIIIIGGRIAELGPLFLDLLWRKLKMVGDKFPLRRTVLAYSCTHDNAVTTGCARYLLDSIFNVNDFLVK